MTSYNGVWRKPKIHVAQIVILGSEASGKTLLLAVLAQRYRSLSGDGFFLQAMTKETNAFTNEVWHYLTIKRDWPPATTPETWMQYKWLLHSKSSSRVAPVELIATDFSGEDFIRGFGEENWTSPTAAELKKSVDQSDAVLLLINLVDLIDGFGVSKKNNIEWAVISCLNYVYTHGFQNVGIAFTQVDRYKAIFEECKTSGSEEYTNIEVLRRYLPQVAGTFTKQLTKGVSQKLEIMRVASVSGTELSHADDESVLERPAKNFQSEGLPELLNWLSKAQSRKKDCNEPPPPRSPIKWLVPVIIFIVSISVVSYLLYGDRPPVNCTWMSTRDRWGALTFNCHLTNESPNKLKLNFHVDRTSGSFNYDSKELRPHEDIEKLGWYEGYRFNKDDQVIISADGYRNTIRIMVE